MKAGDKVVHKIYPERPGVVVRLRDTHVEVLWDGQGIPQRHPVDYIAPFEEVASLPDATGFAVEDEEETEVTSDDPSELSLTILREDEPEEVETDSDPEDVIAPEIIERE
jgi:hypothetical protein